jgi:hypothetical protein
MPVIMGETESVRFRGSRYTSMFVRACMNVYTSVFLIVWFSEYMTWQTPFKSKRPVGSAEVESPLKLSLMLMLLSLMLLSLMLLLTLLLLPLLLVLEILLLRDRYACVSVFVCVRVCACVCVCTRIRVCPRMCVRARMCSFMLSASKRSSGPKHK